MGKASHILGQRKIFEKAAKRRDYNVELEISTQSIAALMWEGVMEIPTGLQIKRPHIAASHLVHLSAC